jgi:hypothetical protein
MRDRLGRPRHPITPITSTQNGPLRLAPGIRRGRSFPGSTTRWSAGGALTSPPVTTSFLLSSAATLPPRSTRRHPRARPPIVSSISRRMTRRASAPAVASSGSARAEAGQPLCGGADVSIRAANRQRRIPPSSGQIQHGSLQWAWPQPAQWWGAESPPMHRSATAGGDQKRSQGGTGGDLKAGSGNSTGARPQMLLSWWRWWRERVRLPSCSKR